MFFAQTRSREDSADSSDSHTTGATGTVSSVNDATQIYDSGYWTESGNYTGRAYESKTSP